MMMTGCGGCISINPDASAGVDGRYRWRHPHAGGVTTTQAWTMPTTPVVWPAGFAVINQLRAAGHAAVFVGGCVRDHLLGHAVSDVDVATSASPDAVAQIFARTEAVGAAFGVMLVLTDNGPIEVASFRSDEAYIDGRRPSGIVRSDEAGDVWRRDFTINALIADPERGEIRDHVGGLEDLDSRRLRVVGDPRARLHEDRLRVLRGLRFAAQLDLTIDDHTWAALRDTNPSGLSRERIWQEWAKGCAYRPDRWWRLVARCGHVHVLAPGLDHAAKRVEDTQTLLASLPAQTDLAVILAIIAKPGEQWPRRLADGWLRLEPIAKRLRRQVGELVTAGPGSVVRDWLPTLRSSSDSDALLSYWCATGLRAEQRAEISAWQAAQALRGPCPFTGRDVLAWGIDPGPAVGAALQRLALAWEQDHIRTAEDARRWLGLDVR